MLMADDRVITFAPQKFAQLVARTPYRPGPADANLPQLVHRNVSRVELAAHLSLETQRKVRLHGRAQMPEIGERGEQRLNASVQVAGVQVQYPHRFPAAYSRHVLHRDLAGGDAHSIHSLAACNGDASSAPDLAGA